jgi:6-phosphogluconate dehydrogenase
MTATASTAADIGRIGLAVIGANLAGNKQSRGNTVAVCRRSTDQVRAFMAGTAVGSWAASARNRWWRP